MLVSFYDWMVQQGLRPDNPARQIRAPRGREPRVRRLTLDETRAFLAAAEGPIERRMAYLAACAGLRCSELRSLQGLHFAREGWISISADLAKGGRERWLPVMVDLEPVVAEIRASTPDEDHVLPATQLAHSPRGLRPVERPDRPCDRKTIWRTFRRIGRRAGIGTPVHPHQLRHAFAARVRRVAVRFVLREASRDAKAVRPCTTRTNGPLHIWHDASTAPHAARPRKRPRPRPRCVALPRAAARPPHPRADAQQGRPRPMSTSRRRVVVHGQVQGVFFRDTARREAAAEGVSGWIRNTPEGTVEAVFEGEPEAVERLVGFAQEGPDAAEVERVETFDEEPEGLEGFETR